MPILVEALDDERFQVTVDGDVKTSHTVRVPLDYARKLTRGLISTHQLVEKSFEFLLERESNSSILRSFELSVIERYFPGYEREIASRLQTGS
jgi:hypothetical protein